MNLATETVIPLAKAAQHLPGWTEGQVSVGTLRRWSSQGIKGVRLETARVGGRIATSIEAIQRFVDRLSGTPVEITSVVGVSVHADRERDELRRFGV